MILHNSSRNEPGNCAPTVTTAISSFRVYPGVLCRTAKTLGYLPGPARGEVIAAAKRTRVFVTDPSSLTPENLLSLIEADR